MINGYYSLPDDVCQAIAKAIPPLSFNPEEGDPVSIDFPGAYYILSEDSKLITGKFVLAGISGDGEMEIGLLFNRVVSTTTFNGKADRDVMLQGQAVYPSFTFNGTKAIIVHLTIVVFSSDPNRILVAADYQM